MRVDESGENDEQKVFTKHKESLLNSHNKKLMARKMTFYKAYRVLGEKSDYEKTDIPHQFVDNHIVYSIPDSDIPSFEKLFPTKFNLNLGYTILDDKNIIKLIKGIVKKYNVRIFKITLLPQDEEIEEQVSDLIQKKNYDNLFIYLLNLEDKGFYFKSVDIYFPELDYLLGFYKNGTIYFDRQMKLDEELFIYIIKELLGYND